MKKYLIIAASIIAMVSCQKNAAPEYALTSDDGAIAFSAYSGTAATKGITIANSDVISTEATGGIGVFAFYQPATNMVPNKFNSTKYATPDFIYNVQVRPDNATAPTKWEYSPVKFWPNNEGDLVSFFAYAPYDKDAVWEDLGLKTDVNATKLTATFPIYTEKNSMVDYLFATPSLNRSKQLIGGAKINFDFKHITSRIAINIGVVVDDVKTAGPMAWTDASTVVTVEKLEFKGIAESYDYSCPIGADGSLGTASWTENGSQDLVLTAKAGDFQNNVINTTTYAAAGWKTLLADETYGAETRPGYLFIAPQDLTGNTLVITYKVVTTNATNPADNSTITNVIKKPVNVIFETGKAYTLNLLIGMKTVELDAIVTPWDETAQATQIDVPENERDLIYPESGTLGIEIDGLLWAPVNCGYDATNYPYGKLYQWGRAVGCGYVSSPAESFDDPGGLIQTFSTNPASTTDPADNIFYKGGDPSNNWYSGTPELKQWPMKSTDAGYLAGKIANPCPEGWRVPTSYELEALCAHKSAWTTVGGQKGYYFSGSVTYSESKPRVFFPAAGRREFYEGKSVNRIGTGFYWSSSGMCLETDSAVAKVTYSFYAEGLSVRCVHE